MIRPTGRAVALKRIATAVINPILAIGDGENTSCVFRHLEALDERRKT